MEYMNNYTSELGTHMVNIWMVWDNCIGTAQDPSN